MSIYARIESGIVVELFTPPAGVPISACFNAALQWVDCTATPGVTQGWSYDGTEFHTPATPPAPTLAQQAQALLAGGLAVTYTSDAALTATYRTDPMSQTKMLGLQVTLTVTGTFPGGATTWPLKDATETPRSMTGTQFAELAVKVAAFVAQCDLVIDGLSTTLPATTATIP